MTKNIIIVALIIGLLSLLRSYMHMLEDVDDLLDQLNERTNIFVSYITPIKPSEKTYDIKKNKTFKKELGEKLINELIKMNAIDIYSFEINEGRKKPHMKYVVQLSVNSDKKSVDKIKSFKINKGE